MLCIFLQDCRRWPHLPAPKMSFIPSSINLSSQCLFHPEQSYRKRDEWSEMGLDALLARADEPKFMTDGPALLSQMLQVAWSPLLRPLSLAGRPEVVLSKGELHALCSFRQKPCCQVRPLLLRLPASCAVSTVAASTSYSASHDAPDDTQVWSSVTTFQFKVLGMLCWHRLLAGKPHHAAWSH